MIQEINASKNVFKRTQELPAFLSAFLQEVKVHVDHSSNAFKLVNTSLALIVIQTMVSWTALNVEVMMLKTNAIKHALLERALMIKLHVLSFANKTC